MKKVAPFLLLTSVGLGLCANSLILSSPLSETSKAICLILSSCVFSSAALMVLVWVLQVTWSTTERPDSSNRLATLARKEQEIAERTTHKKISEWEAEDEWNSLNEAEQSYYRNRKEKHHD